MPYRAMFKAGKEAKKMYDAANKPAASTPAPPRQQRRAEPATTKPSTSPRAKANQAADMLGVPGRNAVRGASTRTEREMKKLGL